MPRYRLGSGFAFETTRSRIGADAQRVNKRVRVGLNWLDLVALAMSPS
jgi:hypothetical protein